MHQLKLDLTGRHFSLGDPGGMNTTRQIRWGHGRDVGVAVS